MSILHLADMKAVGKKPGGSAQGGVFEDDAGSKWIVKSYGNDDQAKSEVLASKLMQAAKCGVADMELIDLDNRFKGGLGVASKHIGAFEDLDPSNQLHRKAASKDFAAHAWLANWDTIGLEFDNTVIQNGKAVHIDPGGSLEWRAMGGKKGERFGPQVGELRTLRDRHMNPTSSQVYKDMTPPDLKASAKNVLSVSDAKIKSLCKAYGPGPAAHKKWLADLLIERKNDLAKQVQGIKTMAFKRGLVALGAARRLQLSVMAHKLNEKWEPGVRGFHSATGALIVAANTGRVLLQLRSPTSDTPNTYGQFGGSIDGNEDITQALTREIGEETGYWGPMILRPLTPSKHPKKDFTYYNMAALVPFEFDPQINEESGGYIWFDPRTEGYPTPLHPGLTELLKDKPSMATVDYLIDHGKYLRA